MTFGAVSTSYTYPDSTCATHTIYPADTQPTSRSHSQGARPEAGRPPRHLEPSSFRVLVTDFAYFAVMS